MTNTYQLTENQERFCEHYAIHGKASEAYRCAYTTAGWSNDMIATEAYRTRKIPHLALRIMELKTDAREAFKVTVAQKKEWLKQIVDAGLTKQGVHHVDLNAAKGAINELNKMDGDHAATKQVVTGTVATTVLSADDFKAARQEMLDSDDC